MEPRKTSWAERRRDHLRWKKQQAISAMWVAIGVTLRIAGFFTSLVIGFALAWWVTVFSIQHHFRIPPHTGILIGMIVIAGWILTWLFTFKCFEK